MKRRIIAITLACTMICAITAGCGNSSSASSTSSKSAQTTSASSKTTDTSSVISVDESSAEVTGGWSINDDETEANLPDGFSEVFDKALEGYTGMSLTPVAYLGSQVVSGTNHMVLCKGTTVTAKPVTSYKVAVIYEDLQGNASVSNVADFDFTQWWGEEDSTSTSTEDVSGGWTVYEDQPTVDLPADAAEAFDSACGTLTGASYEPLALLGSQVVSGTNYAILCRQTIVTADPISNICIVYIYQPLDGDAELTNVHVISLADYNE